MGRLPVSPMTEPATAPSLAAFWQPRYWPVWLGLGLLRVLVLLPYPVMMAAGRVLGRLAGLVLRSRRAVAAANLRLCFPELGPEGQRRLLNRHFESLGQQMLELGMTWWASDARIERLMRIEGLENLERAAASGSGAILLSGHFASVELAGRIMQLRGWRCAGLYRPNRNPLVDEILRRGRLRAAVDVIPKDSMRQMIRRLSQGVSVWYAPDQSYRRRYSVLVGTILFFGFVLYFMSIAQSGRQQFVRRHPLAVDRHLRCGRRAHPVAPGSAHRHRDLPHRRFGPPRSRRARRGT